MIGKYINAINRVPRLKLKRVVAKPTAAKLSLTGNGRLDASILKSAPNIGSVGIIANAAI